ncbi:hypothetical protein MATL_G00130590 [Megalops atlanticus]|uniref:Ig-like domain-containing protein n=1 Tax=Megalops atlanticus TaxID=7932 RepID=A0A9D3PVI7_MEGAT|nr:hypothetical protein MATL_G00130590 [Megalops atlanticus]
MLRLDMTVFYSSCVCALVLPFLFSGIDGYALYSPIQCRFISEDLHDLELLYTVIFNKVKVFSYNSTMNTFIGNTEIGVKNAEKWNQQGIPDQWHTQLDRYCRPNAQLILENILNKRAEPTIQITSAKSASHRHPAMLVCSAYDFYPRGIKVTWLRDGEEVTSDVTSTEELANGDWFYQIHSHLEYTPRSGETISCKVEHSSFTQAKVVDWDPSMPESERNKAIIGASALVLGLIISVAGVIYYKKKSTGRILVPSN